MPAFFAPLQAFLIYLWLFVSCGIGLVVSLFRWRDPDLNRDIGRVFGPVAAAIARLRVRLVHPERLEAHQPCVFVANHQSALDVVTFACVLPHRTLGIGKIELLWIPVFGQYLLAAGNILIRRQSRKHSLSGMSQAAREIRERQVSVLVFPEGTRHTGEGFLPFKKGAFHLAIEAQVPIVPLVHSPLKGLPRRPKDVTIEALEPIETAGLTRKDIEAVIAGTRERMLKAFLGTGDRP